jgi:CheY-like chemotaxis protein
MANVLLVEDNPDTLRSIEKVLRSLNHSVETASNGKEGVTLLKEKAYDLIVTDLLMPGGTGFEVLEWVKNHPQTTPVLICSAYAKPASLKTLMGKHPYILVTKPFRPEDLGGAVTDLLKKS